MDCKFLLGPGRSGTSFFSKWVASHENHELLFDPPVLHRLLALYGKIDNEIIADLINLYIYRDGLEAKTIGRSINMRESDLSYVLSYKTPDAIDEKFEVTDFSTFSICVKVTDAVFKIAELANKFPDFKYLLVVRHPDDVICSIRQKGWFSTRGFTESCAVSTLVWKSYNGICIPHWLPSSKYDEWLDISDTDRAALYYTSALKSALDHKKLFKIINYSSFNDNLLFDQLRSELALQATEVTHMIEKSFKLVTHETKPVLESHYINDARKLYNDIIS